MKQRTKSKLRSARKTFIPFIASMVSLATGLIVFLFNLADLLGIAKLDVSQDKKLTGLLTISGAILFYLGVEFYTSIKNIQESLDTQQTENLSSFYNRLDPHLADIFGNEVKRRLVAVQEAIEGSRITFYDKDRFVGYYKRILNQYSKSVFYATSLPFGRYFWTEANIRMIADFSAGGGKFIRIFYIKQADLENAEVISVLDAHYYAGAEVWLCDLGLIADRLASGRYFSVDSQKRIGWELAVDSEQRITQITGTANKKDLDEFYTIFQEIKDSEATRKYEPPSQDNNEDNVPKLLQNKNAT